MTLYGFLKTVKPNMAVITTRAKKKKKIVFAIEAAPSAIPVKPNTAAIIAITKKIAVHFNIRMNFKVYNFCLFSLIIEPTL
jgi:hypothetical protein